MSFSPSPYLDPPQTAYQYMYEIYQIPYHSSQSALQALPSDPSHSLVIHANSLVSSLLSHKQLVILPGSKCWHLNFHISILSTSGGANLHDVLSIAIKSALWDLRIPRTRRVEFVKPSGGNNVDDIVEDGQDAGMKSLLKGRKKGAYAQKSGKAAADFELIDYEADAGEPLQGRENVPLSITLNLVSNRCHFSVHCTANEVNLLRRYRLRISLFWMPLSLRAIAVLRGSYAHLTAKATFEGYVKRFQMVQRLLSRMRFLSIS